MSQIKLYALGLLGAALGASGDLAGVLAARGVRPVLASATGVLLWAGCYPVWYAMSRMTGGGYAAGAAAWTVSGAVLGCGIALAMREPQSRLEWAGLTLILLGAALRGAGGR